MACDLRIPKRTLGATKFGPGAHPGTVERYCKRKIEIVCSKIPGSLAKKKRGSRRKLEKTLDKLMKDFLITVEAQRRERGLESMTGNKPNKTEAARADGGMRDEENGEGERGDLGEGWAWAEEAAAEQSRMDID